MTESTAEPEPTFTSDIPNSKRQRLSPSPTLDPSYPLPPSPPPPFLDETPPQAALHDVEEADPSLLHNTVSGQLMELQRLSPLASSPPPSSLPAASPSPSPFP